MSASCVFALIFLLAAYLVIHSGPGPVREADPNQLKKSGQQSEGYLEDAGENLIGPIPTRYWLTVSFDGELRTFDVSRKTFYENVQPNGIFTRHHIALIYLPSDPKTFALPDENDSTSVLPPISIMGFIFVLIGALSLTVVVRRLILRQRNFR